MKHKLSNILLIDDDKTTNVLNEMVIKRTGCVDKIVACRNGIEALEYLKGGAEGNPPNPDLILLDINMPGMDGWEFMEEYHKLEETYKGNVVVVMLTTSLNPDDEIRSVKEASLNDFMNKPLTREQFMGLLRKNFPALADEIEKA